MESAGGDFYADTLFNPIWLNGHFSDHQEDDGYAEPPRFYTADLLPSEVLISNPPKVDSDFSQSSPPPTGLSTIAVAGSASLCNNFPEDNIFMIDFVRWTGGLGELRRSEHLREPGTWSEDAYSFPPRSSPSITSSQRSTPRFLASEPTASPTGSASGSRNTPSRLSQRVRVPPAIDTGVAASSATATSIVDEGYEVEIGHVDGSAFSPGSGFMADDESEGGVHPYAVEEASSPEMLGCTDEAGSHVQEHALVPAKRSYAAVVAASPPRAEPVEPSRRYGPSTFGWQPFVELSDA